MPSSSSFTVHNAYNPVLLSLLRITTISKMSLQQIITMGTSVILYIDEKVAYQTHILIFKVLNF